MRTLTAAAPLPLRRRVRAAAALLAAVLLASLLTPMGATGAGRTWLVPADAPLPAGARVLERISLADALLVSAPTAPIGGIAADTPLTFKSMELTAVDGQELDSGVRSTGAEEVWEEYGNRGDGAVVALIDTGVAPITPLQGAVVGEIDFSGTGGGDPYGHGTFMASLIAARGPHAPGVAPEAGILSLKVGDTEGGTTLGMVLNALEWLDTHGRHRGVRIASLALGVDADSPAGQLLDKATDRLATRDMLVITASGNDGEGNLTSPATATRTFSVGAYDQHQNPPTAAEFSGSGPDRVGVQQPDALAAGVSLVGHIDPSSIIGEAHREDLHGTLLKGSGTSMSTGLAAGVAALAQAARPDLGGGALDIALRNDAGVIDAPDAVAAIRGAPGERHTPPAQAGNGNGQAHGRNGTAPGLLAQGHGGPDDLEWSIIRWKGVHWTGDRWHIIRWKDDAWHIIRWKGDAWQIIRWKSAEWNGSGWGDASWDGIELGADWTGSNWQIIRWKSDEWGGDPAWTTIRWKSDPAWTTIRWKADSWTTIRWKASSWTMLTDVG
jgi:serine protease AprX